MFRKARIKLTMWYLLIIMVISFSFSGVIYRASSFEIERFADMQRSRYERLHDPLQPFIDQELVDETKHRLVTTLIFINLGIVGIAGLLGYYLSGKTLSPIQEMLDEQYRFVSDASHELKTPITAIKTTLEVALRDSQLTLGEANKTLQTNLEEVNKLQQLAEGLLELTHKNIVAQRSPTAIREVILAAVQTVEPIAKKTKMVISTKLGNQIVTIDRSSMVRALVIVLDNAIKYSPEKSEIKLTTRVEGKVVRIEVKDHGVGIDESEQELVFDRFYRSDRSRTTDGYGLGLPIAREIVQQNRGKIAIRSKLGKGTSVDIMLPYSDSIQNGMAK